MRISSIWFTDLWVWVRWVVLVGELTIWEVVVYFFCRNWSGNDAPAWLHFAYSLKRKDIDYCRKLSGVRGSAIFPPLFWLTKNSPSLRKASYSNPRPIFSKCIQNDVMSMRRCLTSFQKKLYTTKVVCVRGRIWRLAYGSMLSASPARIYSFQISPSPNHIGLILI